MRSPKRKVRLQPTPRLWVVKEFTYDGDIEVIDTRDAKVVATLTGCTPEALALISAAPELLKAAGGLILLAHNKHNVIDSPKTFIELLEAAAEDARRAIEKAEGKK